MTDGMFLALAILTPVVLLAIFVPLEFSKGRGGLAKMGLRSQFVPLPAGLWMWLVFYFVVAGLVTALTFAIALGWLPEAQWIQAKYGVIDVWPK